MMDSVYAMLIRPSIKYLPAAVHKSGYLLDICSLPSEKNISRIRDVNETQSLPSPFLASCNRPLSIAPAKTTPFGKRYHFFIKVRTCFYCIAFWNIIHSLKMLKSAVFFTEIAFLKAASVKFLETPCMLTITLLKSIALRFEIQCF
ncbi:hypothetical protein [Niallia sp. FSL R7-0271]|uniref:hypothetical protein n=1 Tax=Niallia sp. FSL R7-0271 TaxID=2921678 RepID=UPI0030F5DB9B